MPFGTYNLITATPGVHLHSRCFRVGFAVLEHNNSTHSCRIRAAFVPHSCRIRADTQNKIKSIHEWPARATSTYIHWGLSGRIGAEHIVGQQEHARVLLMLLFCYRVKLVTITMSKRKLPESLGSPLAAHNQENHSPEQEHPAHQMAQVAEQMETPPRRTVPKGSPADEFMRASPAIRDDVSTLTCDISLIPKDRWNKRRTLSAIVLAVLPIKAKSSTVRRNVVLRDEFTECTVTVWGNHTNILNDSAIGRPVTLQRICLTEFEGKTQVAMPKDCSVALGNTALTAPIMVWIQRVGTTAISVQQVSRLL